MKINLIKHNGRLIPKSEEDRELVDNFKDGAIYVCEINNMDKRTLAQNRLIHKFCDNVSVELKKQNIPLKVILKDGTYLTMLAVKELVFKNTVRALYGKESTTTLNRDELNLVFDTVIFGLGRKGLDTKNLLDKEEK